MRCDLVAVVLLTVLSLPASVVAPLGAHAVRGVLKSVTSRAIVLARSPSHRGDMTLVLTASTQRVGPLMVGSRVSVRYICQHDEFVATAVAADP